MFWFKYKISWFYKWTVSLPKNIWSQRFHSSYPSTYIFSLILKQKKYVTKFYLDSPFKLHQVDRNLHMLNASFNIKKYLSVRQLSVHSIIRVFNDYISIQNCFIICCYVFHVDMTFFLKAWHLCLGGFFGLFSVLFIIVVKIIVRYFL